MKTILIAGGAGFIGSHLCERLLNEKNRIICLDNLFTGSKENIKHLFENENFVFLNHDIINKLSIDEPIHQIYNLACPASPEKYQLDPIYTLKIIFIGGLWVFIIIFFIFFTFIEFSIPVILMNITY